MGPDPSDTELALFPTTAEADQAVAGWQQRLFQMPGFWLALAGYTCVVAVIAVLLLLALRHWVPLPTTPAGKIILVISAGPIFGSCVWLGGNWMVRRRFRRFLRERLLTLGVPVCLACGYDLRGQQEPRCPECGRDSDPSPGATPPGVPD